MLKSILGKRRVSLSHLSPELLAHAALGSENPETVEHLNACPDCRAEVEQLRDAAGLLRVAALSESRLPTPGCPDELVIAAFLDGGLDGDARARVVDHLLECGRCRALVKATSEIADQESAIGAGPARGSQTWRWSLSLGLAAAAVLAFFLVPARQQDGVLREPPLTSTIAPVPLQPAPDARIARVERFVWSAVPGAERYRLRVYDVAGNALLDTQTVDTSAVLPDSIALSDGAPYFWRVEARADWQRWSASDLVQFRVSGRQ